MQTFLVMVVGTVTGALGGLFGKGGSAIATPMLAAVGVRSFAAVASPLPATIPATLVAAYAYWRAGEIDRRVLSTVIWVGVPATIVGALVSSAIGGSALVLICDLIVAALGVRILAHRAPAPAPALVPVGGPGPGEAEPRNQSVVAVAVIVGLASGLLANSGGFLLAPLFVTTLRLPFKKALGTSLAAAAALAVPGTIVHAALGHIDWSVAVPFGLASVPLSAFGAHLALRTDASRLETIYGAVLIVFGLGLLLIRL
jgi:uncharacterized membrane protein YfcA